MVTHQELLLGPVGTLCMEEEPNSSATDPNNPQLIAAQLGVLLLTINILLGTGKVHGLDTTHLLLLGRNGGGNTSSDGRGTHSTGSSDESALLHGGGGQLARQRAQSLGEAAGGHCDVNWRRSGDGGEG